ncbi:MAG: hypothetical protein ACLPPV_14020 [Candidatus Korobacteraceae bacterium]|jgi:hypothetical protein
MLYTIKNLTAVYPKLFRTKTAESKLPVQSVRMDELKVQSVHSQLSRVWIETGDPRTPLKSVWIDEPELHSMTTMYPIRIHSCLSRVWIWTEDPRMPLKSVLIDEAEMHDMANEAGEALLAEIEMLMAEAYASE